MMTQREAPLSADNDEPSADQYRLATRIATRYFLQSLALVRAFGRKDILDGLILLAITDANTRHLTAPDSGYRSSDDVPPDAARQPVSVYLVARELGLSYETARRHVQNLIKAGLVERIEQGVVVPGRVFADPQVVDMTRKTFINTRRFVEVLRQSGIFEAR